MSCMSPCAPLWETASGWKADSTADHGQDQFGVEAVPPRGGDGQGPEVGPADTGARISSMTSSGTKPRTRARRTPTSPPSLRLRKIRSRLDPAGRDLQGLAVGQDGDLRARTTSAATRTSAIAARRSFTGSGSAADLAPRSHPAQRLLDFRDAPGVVRRVREHVLGLAVVVGEDRVPLRCP